MVVVVRGMVDLDFVEVVEVVDETVLEGVIDTS